MKINGNLVLNSDASGEIRNLYVERLASAPTFSSGEVGRLYFNTVDSIFYFNNGSVWTSMAGGSIQTEIDAIETSLGAGINSDGTFHAAGFSTASNISSPTSFTDAILQLDSSITASGHTTLSSMNDVNFTSIADKNLIQYDSGTSKWKNVSLSTAGIQAHDAGLDALAAKTTTGILVQTGNDTFTSVTITAPAAGITISNGDGVAGNPTLALANGLASIESLSSTGFLVQSVADTFIARSVATASSARITVTNGDGVSGNPTLDLATVSDSGTGSFKKITTDSYGRVTGTASVVASDITALVDSTYVNVSGDTMSGVLNMGSNQITSVATPTSANDAATKGYVDSVAGGLTWQQPVANVQNVDLGSGSLDSTGLSANDRVLNTFDTKIYTWNGSAFNAGTSPASSWAVFDNTNETGYVFNGTVWVQFTGTGQITAGVGLSKTGNVLDVNLGAGIAELPTDEIGIDLYSSVNALRLTTDGSTASTATNAKLTLVLKSSGGLTQDTNGLYIPAAGVANAMLANSSVTVGVDGGGTTTLDLGGSISVLGTSGQGISTSLSSGNVVITAANATTTQKGVASFNTSHFSVSSGAVSLAASIAKLTNVASTADTASSGDVLSYNTSTAKWENVTRAAVVGSTSIGAHNDVTITSAAAGDTLVFSSGSSKFVNRPTYFLYTAGSALTTHTVTHSLGQQYCNVTVVDDTDNVVIPESIVFNSTTQLTVTFSSALQCKVVVMGVNAG